LEVTLSIQLHEIDIGSSCAEGEGEASDGVAAIGGLNEGVAFLTLWSADGFGPLEVTLGIQLDDIDIVSSCAEGFGEAGDGVAAIGALNEGDARFKLFFPPIALQKWGEGPLAGMVSEGREIRMYALCMGNVAATRGAKDKDFSRVLMWAKVGRKELCQGGSSFLRI